MSALFTNLRKKPELTPLFISVAGGVFIAAGYGLRTLLSHNDVVLNKSQQQQFRVKPSPKMISEDYIMQQRMKMQDGTWLR